MTTAVPRRGVNLPGEAGADVAIADIDEGAALIGAQQSDGTGPVLGLRDAEAVFSRAKAAATVVRAAYSMENWGRSLYAVEQGVLPTFLVADKARRKIPTSENPA